MTDRERPRAMRSRMLWPSAAAVLTPTMLFWGLAGCSGGGNESSDAGSTAAPIVVVQAQDFAQFRSWTSFSGVGPPGAPQPPDVDGGIHSGPLTTYINMLPPHGSTSFPIGTIIVKEPTTPPLTQRSIFAMVKVGGGYNGEGAVDWKWFELQSLDAQSVTILWSGAVVPSTQGYGGTPTICNDCHAMNRANDFVWTAGLNLSAL